VRWQQNPPASLTAIAGLCQSALANELNELDRALYSQGKNAWRGESLWQLFVRNKPGPVVKQPEKNESLKPLFPSSS